MTALRKEAPVNSIELGASDLSRLSVIARSESGILLGPEKADFLVARLSRRVLEKGFRDYQSYCDYIEGSSGIEEKRAFLELITTHTTSFFRESGHYTWLAETGVPSLAEAGVGLDRELTVWSAACSTGPELYSALMTLSHERDKRQNGLRFRGIGTDLSRAVVRSAENAVYSDQEVSGIPEDLRNKFLLVSKTNRKVFRVSPELRGLSEWRVANLIQRETLSNISADVVFIRNVLIYFEESTQERVLQNILSCLRPGGYLLTGHSETNVVRGMSMKTIRPTIYQKAK